MSARLMNALGASELERTICATAGIAGTTLAPRPLAGGRSRAVAPRALRARLGLEPDVDRAAPVAQAARRAQGRRAARRHRPVPQPHRARGRRAPRPLPGTDAALALGMMRAIVDAGLADEDWCRAHADGYDELLARLGERPVERARRALRRRRRDDRARGPRVRPTQPALLRLGVGAQRHLGAPIAYRTLACLPALVGAWRHVGGGCSYVPTATAAASPRPRSQRAELRPGPVRTINMSQLGAALTDPSLDPPVKALVVLELEPGRDRARPGARAAGLRREDLFTVVLEQFMTDTARHADVVLPATTQLEHLDALLLGPPLPDLERAGDRAGRRGEAEHRDLPAAGRAAGLDDPLLPRDRRGAARPAARRLAEERPSCASAAGPRSTSARAPTPHADGGFARTEVGQRSLLRGRLRCRSPAEVADEALAERFPLALVTPKTHLFLNSTFAEPAPPALGAARARGGRASRPTRSARGIADGAVVRVCNDRGAFSAPRACRTTRARACSVAPMGWWNARLRRRPQRAGDDVAAADGDRQRADLQRQPRRARAAQRMRP